MLGFVTQFGDVLFFLDSLKLREAQRLNTALRNEWNLKQYDFLNLNSCGLTHALEDVTFNQTNQTARLIYTSVNPLDFYP